MNRNDIIVTFINKVLIYAFYTVTYYGIFEGTNLNLQTMILIRTRVKYGTKIIKYTAKTHAKIDFKSQIMLSDAIDVFFLVN